MMAPRFGNALFERSAPFHAQPVATERLERLKNFGGFPGRLARVLAKRMEKDLYEPSGRMAKNAQALPYVIKSAHRELKLRTQHLERLRQNSAKPGILRKATMHLEIAALKLANARLARRSCKPGKNRPVMDALRAALRRLDDLGYAAGRRLAPAYVQAKANSGAFTLNHDVYHYTKMDNGEDMPYQEIIFEGMAVSPHPTRSIRNHFAQNMQAELPDLEQAIDLASRMKTGNATDVTFAEASLNNLKAEAHHALSHYVKTRKEFRKQSQNARKAVKRADKILQSIPISDLTPEHARLAYNLNRKAAHLCNRHKIHAPKSNRAKEVCATITEKGYRKNIHLMERLPWFDPSYGEDFLNAYLPFSDQESESDSVGC